MPSRIRKQNRFGIHPNRFYLKLPKIMKTLACKALSNMLKSSNMTQRPSRNIYGRVFLFYPIILFKKIFNHICRGHNPDQKFTFAYWQSMKSVFDKIEAVSYGACRRNDYYFFAITCRTVNILKTMDSTLSAHLQRQHRILSTGPYSLAYPLFCYR
jgi:hypothetical protein